MTLSSCTEKPLQGEKKCPMNFKCGFRKYLCKLAKELLQYYKFTTIDLVN